MKLRTRKFLAGLLSLGLLLQAASPLRALAAQLQLLLLAAQQSGAATRSLPGGTCTTSCPRAQRSPQTAASWHCWCGTPQADLNL